MQSDPRCIDWLPLLTTAFTAQLTNYSSIDRPPRKSDRAKERQKAASSGGPPRWATSAS